MSLEIANIIKKQLYYSDGNLMGCLGTHNFRGGDEVEGKHLGYLMFDVSNLRDMKKGTVQIILSYKDLYNINIYKEDYELFSTSEDIYCDQLTSVLENILGT